MGRKKKPTTLHLLEGTFRPDRHNVNEPIIQKPDLVKLRVPAYLSPQAKRIYKHLREVLLKIRVVSEADRTALEIMAEAYAEFRLAEKQLRDDGITYNHTDEYGNTTIKPHPAVRIKQMAYTRWKSLASEFGLTPAARTKVSAEIKRKEPETLGKKAKSW